MIQAATTLTCTEVGNAPQGVLAAASTGISERRAGVLGTPLGLHRQVRLLRLRGGIQVPIQQLPARLNADPQGQNLVPVHGRHPSLNPWARMA